MPALQWNGRDVIVAEFNVRAGRAVRAAFKVDNETGSYAALAASLRYADSNDLVFQSVDEVEDQPFRLQQRLLRLASEAAKVNGMLGDTDDDDDSERVT